MEEIRSLPPLVRGKVTGFLDFFIDEVRIFRNILLLTDKCNIIVQVQWWGEKLPVYIIPKNSCSKQSKDTSFNFPNTYFHSATYKIKTKFDLFKSYLKSCEVLELAVLRAVENLVIGSAFMKDLIRLLNNIHDPIILPLVDSLGEEIGEIKIHTNFSQECCRVSKNEYFSQSVGNPVLMNESRDKGNEVTQKVDSDCVINYETVCKRCSPDFETTNMYKINRDLRVLQLNESQNELTKVKPSPLKEGFNSCECEINQVSRGNEKCRSSKIIEEDLTQAEKKLESKTFPQTHILSDCSKVLYFDLQGKKKYKNCKQELKSRKVDSLNTYGNFAKSRKSQSKISETPNRFSTNRKSSSVAKKVCTVNKKSGEASHKTLCKVHQNSEKERNNSFKKVMTTVSNLQSQSDLGNRNSSVIEEGNEKILNYLLGCKMSKDDEQSALNDLRRNSLSPHFVESINELCTGSFHRKPKSSDNQEFTSCQLETPKNVSKKINNLKFDLSNTIERNYFKKFFSSECSENPFQIAEDLNMPKNNFVLENCETVDSNCVNESSHFHTATTDDDLEKNFLKFGQLQRSSDDLNYKDLGSNATSRFWSQEKVPTDCSNCKYYKQFSELDTIIESLKHFDKRVKRKDN